MQERVKEVPKRILEWWNKFSAKQKTLIAGIAIAVIIGLAFVVKVLTTPTMITIQNCKDTKEAAKVKELLVGEDIYYEVSDDGLNFQVKTGQMHLFCWGRMGFRLLLTIWRMCLRGASARQKQIRINATSFIWKNSLRRICSSLMLSIQLL